MSKIVLCPLTFNTPMSDSGIYDCVGEKCAWWIKASLWEPGDGVESAKWDYIRVPGHCVVLDWGKR